MTKAKTIRSWSHGRLRGVMAGRAKRALSSLLVELRRDPLFPKGNSLSAGSPGERDFLSSMAKRIAVDLAGPGFRAYQEIVKNGTYEDISSDEIVQQVRAKRR